MYRLGGQFKDDQYKDTIRTYMAASGGAVFALLALYNKLRE